MDFLKTVIVTGANRGIGKETARELAMQGYHVILACRNMDKAEEARAEIVRESGNDHVHCMELDLSRKTSILRFVQQFAASWGKLNVLVNNAGISSSEPKKTEDGYEINIGTNFVGTYLLTMNLLPLFDELHEKRIINIASNIAAIGWFDIKRINSYRWFVAYAVSKRMLLLFTKWLSAEKERDNFRINAVHPGVVDTSIMYTGKWYDVFIKILCRPFFVSVQQGAKPAIDLVTRDDTENGKYFVKGEPREIALSRGKRRELLDLLEFCKTL